MMDMKHCFTYHILLHSLFGLGLGLLLATWIPALQNVWIGVIVLVVAVILDAMSGGKKPTATPPTPAM